MEQIPITVPLCTLLLDFVTYKGDLFINLVKTRNTCTKELSGMTVKDFHKNLQYREQLPGNTIHNGPQIGVRTLSALLILTLQKIFLDLHVLFHSLKYKVSIIHSFFQTTHAHYLALLKIIITR